MWALFPSIVIGVLLLVLLALLGQIYEYTALIYSSVGILVGYIIYLIFVIKEFQVKPPPAPRVVEKQVIKRIEKVKEVVKQVIKPDIEEEDFIALKDYVRYNIYYGHKREKIVEKLLSVGWKKEKIDQALKEIEGAKQVKNKKNIVKK